MAGKGSGRYASKLAETLFPDSEERTQFVQCLSGIPLRPRAVVWPFGKTGSVGVPGPLWWPDSCEVLSAEIKVGDLTEHHNGDIYSLDPSSVFEGGVLQAVDRKSGTGPDLCIDVCAAPGGKAMIAHSVLRPKRMVCNEVIGKRLGMLRFNLSRCHVEADVRNLDPGRLAEEFKGQAHVVIVDAPCSGQSVLVKGGENPGCFNPRTVESNAMRQRRILSESAKMVAAGGWLMYSTCTFSLEENERLVEWFLTRNPGFSEVEYESYAPLKSQFGPGYREWPHSGLGVGGFTCLLRLRP